ncbi:peptide-methionine (R)-S-oxide reductase [Flavobacterium sp. 1]|uniref:peptide-methionine (R)-S-oxide reductase MsrB n=1 Tax=Flavobacterium sp. 1 TaxID=2035200 RepID=UPI000C23F196|nr:peptide-methionine (R)-S-oxide reductase MsrB [Flavobacterium sp. 1]PJJ11004.1 peptide-methionine (R)-S-oxide reductase [Flavobacterium sp. 1]
MKTKTSFFGTLLLLPLFIFQACGQSKETKSNTMTSVETYQSKPGNPYYSHTDTAKLNLSDAEWKKILPEDVYLVSRKADTERPFTGKYWNTDVKGTYYCAACGNLLFRSGAKFSSSCGWPSFFEQENKKSVVFKDDNSIGMERIEALCGRCGGHLGHLFDDGPVPTGKRYCMNSIALDFVPDAK